MHAIFEPTRIAGELEDLFVVNAAAGEEMSIIVAHGKIGGKIFERVFSCGNNLKGQLGINRVSHVNDLTVMPDISDLFDEADEALFIDNLQCGRRHCVASFDYGAFVSWGDNQVGQLGNRKRSFVESPYPHKKFEQRHNVQNVVLGVDSSGVIVEDTGKEKKKRKKNKRILERNEVITNEADLKARSEQVISKEEDPKAKGKSKKRIGERLREKVLTTFYGKQD